MCCWTNATVLMLFLSLFGRLGADIRFELSLAMQESAEKLPLGKRNKPAPLPQASSRGLWYTWASS